MNNTVPTGIPELVMGYTGDGQITPGFVTQRDELFGVNTTEIREQRSGIVAPAVIEGADSWVSCFLVLPLVMFWSWERVHGGDEIDY